MYTIRGILLFNTCELGRSGSRENMKHKLSAIFLLSSIQGAYVGAAVEINQAGEPIAEIIETPVFTLQLSHIIVLVILLSLVSIITLQRRRFELHKQKQLKRERIAATRTEELYKKYRLVLRANHTIVWTWNLDTKNIECESDRCRDIGKYWTYRITEDSFYSRIHPDDEEKIRTTYQDLMDGKITMFQEEFRYTHLHGSEGYDWVQSFAIVGESKPDGHVLTLVGGMVTITERKQLELKAKKKEQAEEASRMKSAFLSSVRHEVRTPLNAIVGFSNLMAGGADQEEAAEYSKIIQYNSALLVQLVDDVLDMSDIESGQIEFTYAPVDIAEMLQSLEKAYLSRVKDGVRLLCESPADSLFAVSDGHRLKHVLKNFLSNACKFTFAGQISFGYERTEEGLYFYVTDTGIGLAEENIPLAFDRFAKFDNYTQGVGMGLAVCQSIVHKMKGEIGVVSELGKGSKFWFKIPCRLQSDAEIEEANAEALEGDAAFTQTYG